MDALKHKDVEAMYSTPVPPSTGLRSDPVFNPDEAPELIDNVHGTVLSPNAVWVRRPANARKRATPMRSPDGIERAGGYEDAVGEDEENVTPSKKTTLLERQIEEHLGEEHEVKTAGQRNVQGKEKEKGRQLAPAGGRTTRSAGRTPASGKKAGGSALFATADVNVAVNNAMKNSGSTAKKTPTTMRRGRQRRKSTKLQSDEFVTSPGEDGTSPGVSEGQPRSDDDEFVPAGVRVGAGDKRRPKEKRHSKHDSGAEAVAGTANAAGRQTPMAGAQDDARTRNTAQVHAANNHNQQIKTPSMNLFHHFQEIKSPARSTASDLAGDIQRALEENIQAEADRQDIRDLEAEIAKVNENTMAWEEMLESKAKIIDELRMQNMTLKELFGGLGLSKAKNLVDFSMKDIESEEARRKTMLSFGRRLVTLLRQGKETAEEGVVKQDENGEKQVEKKEQVAVVKSETTGVWTGTGTTHPDATGAPTNDGATDAADAIATDVENTNNENANDNSNPNKPKTTNPRRRSSTFELEERFHPIAAQVAGAGLQAAKGDPARAVMYLINKGFQARQNDGFQGDPPPEFRAREGAEIPIRTGNTQQ